MGLLTDSEVNLDFSEYLEAELEDGFILCFKAQGSRPPSDRSFLVTFSTKSSNSTSPISVPERNRTGTISAERGY